MKIYKVYKLTSPSNKYYIGFTSDTVDRRFAQHKQSYKQWIKSGRQRTGVCTKLFYAFDAYTPESFKREVLLETTNKEEALAFEIQTITKLSAIESGYNLCIGGTSGFSGIKQTAEHRQRLSNARKAYYETPEGQEWKNTLSERYKQNNPSHKGMKSRIGHHTEESKQKISTANRGRKQTTQQVADRAKRMKDLWESGRFNNRKRPDRSKVIPKTGWQQPESQKQKVAAALRKTWIITHPNGLEETVTDLKQFAKTHNLASPNNFTSVARGKLPHYKGYKARHA